MLPALRRDKNAMNASRRIIAGCFSRKARYGMQDYYFASRSFICQQECFDRDNSWSFNGRIDWTEYIN